MAESLDLELSEGSEGSSDPGTVALAAALDEAGRDPALRATLAAFFDTQRHLIDEQKHHLHVQLGQLRLRTVSDGIKLAIQSLTLLVILGVVAMVGVMIRDAIDDHGLVIERLSASPSLAARGFSAEVLTDRIAGRLDAIRRIANDHSLTVSDEVRNGGGGEMLKVEIPETGISLEQIDRFLHQTLGHARRLGGGALEEHGQVTIDLQVSQGDPIQIEGPAAELDHLIELAAERAFQSFDPVNYILYLTATGRFDEALTAAENNSQLGGTPLDLSNGLALWGNVDGDRRRALARAQLAAEIYPKGWAGSFETGNASRDLGHDEAALQAFRRLADVKPEDQWRNHREALPGILKLGRIATARLLGDYDEIERQQGLALVVESRTDQRVRKAQAAAGRHDCAGAAHEFETAKLVGTPSPRGELKMRQLIAACAEKWSDAAETAKAVVDFQQSARTKAQAAVAGRLDAALATIDKPQLAWFLALSGHIAEAEALAAASPLDCYFCLRTRALVASLASHPEDADRWYLEAEKQGPSLPWAYLERARFKLAGGDAAAAIAELKIAQSKSPKLGDIPELWGEALAKQGDFQGAVGKFTEADALTPNWARLHRVWSEALAKLNKQDEADKHLALAAQLAG